MSTKEWRDKNREKLNKCKREYYYRNLDKEKSRIRKTNAIRKLELKEWFDDYRSNLSCARCDENHIACLEFHHIDPSEKEVEVGRAVTNGWNKERIIKEMEKCEVLCSNCHRKHHWQQRQ